MQSNQERTRRRLTYEHSRHTASMAIQRSLQHITLSTRWRDFNPSRRRFGLVGCECKRVCMKSLLVIFILSFTEHSCSLISISFYPRICAADEDQRSRRMAIGQGFNDDRLWVTECYADFRCSSPGIQCAWTGTPYLSPNLGCEDRRHWWA